MIYKKSQLLVNENDGRSMVGREMALHSVAGPAGSESCNGRRPQDLVIEEKQIPT